ncbi:GtrA family protein [Anaerosacchariphilus sp. NSJ-68]|uniref:GtrA family protein n=2 Tax=Lachnospiraceae TaxID=186803 RepID=A0A923RMI8_9FIRM|nr:MULTISPECIES: GtrA family protein [Lachnospiraceae]MBC5660324.1 GtrA family protein [Anaerosacchariphilus hominis]MBC5697828.1 GtrA family protein [Roseburia difficilis]
MKKLFGQIIKFGAVGFLCFFIDYFIMVALTELAGIPSFVSSACSYTISTVVNYILSITVVFDADKEANKTAQFAVFVILSLIGLGINQLMMWAGTSWLEGLMGRNSALAAYARYAYMVVKIFATAVVMVYNFITRKIFIEKH